MTRLTPPNDLAELVTLAEAKQHLRVTHLKEDDLIKLYLAAITDYLDGYEGALGRALRPQEWRLTIDGAPCSGTIRLPLVPFTELVAIEYDDPAGQTHVIDETIYRAREDLGFGLVQTAYGQSWPTDIDTMRITYECGHDVTRPMPAAIKAAALLMLGDLYSNRSAQVEGKIINVNPTVENLLTPYRVRSWR
jgi:uncharacterized phiE125 gp8 family phage protein